MSGLQSLMAAYFAVWAVFFVYEITVSRRLGRLQAEVARLKGAAKHE